MNKMIRYALRQVEQSFRSQHIVVCDFAVRAHRIALCKLINEYVSDEMGLGQYLTRDNVSLLRGLESHPHVVVLLVRDTDVFVGILVAFVNFSTFACKPIVNVHDLFVSRNNRRQGFGRMLLLGITEVAKALSSVWITLEVRKDNKVAKDLYISEGFREADWPMYFWKKKLTY